MKINEIENNKYQGYVWLSNADKPIILPQEKFDFSQYSETENPFIVEALLFCKDDNTSITIQHTGKYHIHEFDFKNIKAGSVLEDVSYLPHKLANIEKVNFKQLWLPEEDENCAGMPVLKMKALIFTGFNKK